MTKIKLMRAIKRAGNMQKLSELSGVSIRTIKYWKEGKKPSVRLWKKVVDAVGEL